MKTRCLLLALLALLTACGYGGLSDAIKARSRGVEAYDKGDYDRAVVELGEAIRLDPKYADAHFARAHAWRMKGDTDRAIAGYSETIQLNPKFAIAYVGRGAMWDLKGDCAKAKADRQAAGRLSPKAEDDYRSSRPPNCP